MSKPLRILAVLEAQSVTGPARNLLEFCKVAPHLEPPGSVETMLATFRRAEGTDLFVEAVSSQQTPLTVISERSALDFSTLHQLRELAKRFQPDIIQTHGVKSHFLMRLSGLPAAYCWVAWHHGYTKPTFKQEIYNQFDKVSLRKARLAITVTRAFVAELRRAGVSQNIEIVRNALDPQWAQGIVRTPGSSNPWAGPGTKIVLAIGRLSKEKGHADLVKAVALLQKEIVSPVHLLLVGEGPERENLAALAKSKDVAITFAGHAKDVRPFFAASDYFVLPSHSEGSPNVLIEAMAAGIPIVSTDVGGVTETLTHEREALLVSPARPDLLAASLRRLIEIPQDAKQLIKAATERVKKEFLPEARARQIVGLYRNLLS